nr:hypothetical protein [Tanacetum cinerariifolium]
MALTFADTHNMIAYLTKPDKSEGFDQIIDFLNASSINLVGKKKVIITEATIRESLRFDDAESIDCLPNEEIFTELSRMGTSWNEFSSSKASAVICLLTGRKFNFSKVGKGFSGVDTPLFEGMIVAQQDADIADEGAASVVVDDVPAAVDEPSIPSTTPTTQPPLLSQDLSSTSQDKIAQTLEIRKLKQRVKKLERRIIANIDADEDVTLKDVAAGAKDVADVEKDAEIEENADVLSMYDDKLELAKLKEVVEVVTTAKLMTEVVTVASATINAANTLIIVAVITTAPSVARRRKGVVIRDPEETATPSIIIHFEPKSKDKGKGIMVEEPKPLKKQAQFEQDEAYARELEAELNKNINWDEVIEKFQRKEKEDNVVMRYQALKREPQTEAKARKNMMIYLRNMAGFKMDYFKGMSYDDIHPIFEKKFNSNVAFLEKIREQMEEEDSKALKRASKSQAEKAAKK